MICWRCQSLIANASRKLKGGEGMEIADEYFNNCRKIAERESWLMQRKVRYQVFDRHDGIVMGADRAVNFIRENTYGPIKITGIKDGDKFSSGEPVLTVEGLFRELVNLETTELGFLCYSGAATEMAKLVKTAQGVPVIDMSARHYPYQMIEEISAAAYWGGSKGTSTPAGHDYVQSWYNPGDEFRLYASLPHAMAAVVAEIAEKKDLYPSVVASQLLQKHLPDKPITVLVDYEGQELDVAEQAFEVFGDQLFAVRLDTHGERNMQGTFNPDRDREAYNFVNDATDGRLDMLLESFPEKYFWGNGVTVEAVFKMRRFLDDIGAKHVRIVVSSGFNAKKIEAFQKASAPMDFIGSGSWVKFFMFTADISHVWENGQWQFRTKVGRRHGKSKRHQLLFERE